MIEPPPNVVKTFDWKWREWLNRLHIKVDSINTTLDAGTGAWVKIDDYTPTATNTYDITWDETAYHAVRFQLESLGSTTDGTSWFIQVGSADGATIQTANYTGCYSDMAGAFANAPGSGDIRLCQSWGNAAGEELDGVIEVRTGNASSGGALIDSQVSYKKTNGTRSGRIFHSLWGDSSGAAIDTIRFAFLTGTDVHKASGTITAYGLTV